MNRRIARGATLLLVLLGLAAFSPARARAEKLDWSAARHIPVHHDGRIMPLDTFAREMVTKICGKENPTLAPPEADYSDPKVREKYAEVLELFPEGEPRKFKAIELLFSWLLEGEKWYDVPFLLAEYNALRTEYLGVPATNEEGEKLKYVSLAQLQDFGDEDNPRASKFHERFDELRRLDREARAKGESFEPTETVDEKILDLARSAETYLQITFRTDADGAARRDFEQKLNELRAAWGQVAPVLGGLAKFASQTDQGGGQIAAAVEHTMALSGEVFKLSDKPTLDLTSAGPLLATFAESTERIAENFDDLRSVMLGDPRAADSPDLRQKLDRMVDEAQNLADLAQETLAALYENHKLLRVVPALNPEALDGDRTAEDDEQPWLDLQTLLYAPPQALKGYPQEDVTAVREAFLLLRKVYVARSEKAEARTEAFEDAMQGFADALRAVGENVEPARRELDIANRDEALLAYTQYPSSEGGEIAIEVRYNTLQPFMWAWVIFLLSLVCFALSFGVVRKPMFWAGMLILLFGIGWTVYGFYMRVVISGWAPVTSMYETVVYVPLFVAMLATWLAWVPVLWPGLKAGWRLSAIPGTWEQSELTDEQRSIMSESRWDVSNWLALAPRLGMMVWMVIMLSLTPYWDDGSPIFALKPKIGVGSSLPGASDLMTWLVGLSILLVTLWYGPRVIIAALASFATVPLTRPRPRNAWRLNAIPGTFEETELTKRQQELMPADQWRSKGTLMAVPRLVLMTLFLYLLAFKPLEATRAPLLSLTLGSEAGIVELVGWFLKLVTLGTVAWFGPRVVLMAATSLAWSLSRKVKERGESVFAQLYPRKWFLLAGMLAAWLGTFIAWWTPLPGESFEPLQPVLRSNFWLTIHVLTIVSSYGAGMLAWGLGLLALGFYLFGRYRREDHPELSPELASLHRPAGETAPAPRQPTRPPEVCNTLSNYTYKAMQVAVLLLAAGTILGGVWADKSWGRFWGWDPKEVWALISLLVYLGILHGRFAGWFGNFGLCVGSVVGASAIIMSWYGVNFVLGVGLHAYAFGTGGQYEVFGTLAAIWAFTLAAAVRYHWETSQSKSSFDDAENQGPPQQRLEATSTQA